MTTLFRSRAPRSNGLGLPRPGQPALTGRADRSSMPNPCGPRCSTAGCKPRRAASLPGARAHAQRCTK